jgi:uncharacterized protein YraI
MTAGRWAISVVGALVTPLALIAPASAAPGDVGTMSCTHAHSDQTTATGRTTTELKFRAGPHQTCAQRGVAADGALIRYHCWTVGQMIDGVDTWTWGQVSGTNYYGWFSDRYLNDGGAPASAKC